jgi:hypothetical protein
LSVGSHAWCLPQPTASVACTKLGPSACSLMMPSLSVVASWWHYLCLFLVALAPSLAPGMVMLRRPSTVLLGPSVVAWRGHKSVPPCVRLLVAPIGIPLGLRHDLLYPLSSSWCQFCVHRSGHALIRWSYQHASGSLSRPWWNTGEETGWRWWSLPRHILEIPLTKLPFLV